MISFTPAMSAQVSSIAVAKAPQAIKGAALKWVALGVWGYFKSLDRKKKIALTSIGGLALVAGGIGLYYYFKNKPGAAEELEQKLTQTIQQQLDKATPKAETEKTNV